MHEAVNVVHLNLSLDNIIIAGDPFIINPENGEVTIDLDISCKLVDFSLSGICIYFILLSETCIQAIHKKRYIHQKIRWIQY